MPGYHLPYFAAAENGVFAEHGLEVEIVDPEPGIANVEAVAAGRYDACLTSVAYFLEAKDEQPTLAARFIFMVARRPHMAAFFMSGRAGSHGRSIESFADLEGASFVGPADSPFAAEYFSLLDHLGLSPGAVVDLPYGETIEALVLGKGDVSADYLDLLPRFAQAAEGSGLHVGALPFFEAGLEVYGSGLVAGTHFIKSRPEAARRLTGALAGALRTTRSRPEAGLEPLLARYPATDRATAVAGWTTGETLIFGDDDDSLGAMDDQGWKATTAHHLTTRGIVELPPEELYDLSFLEP